MFNKPQDLLLKHLQFSLDDLGDLSEEQGACFH